MLKQTKKAALVFKKQEDVIKKIDELLVKLPQAEKVDYLEGLLFTILNTQKQVLDVKASASMPTFQEHNVEVKLMENGLDIMQYYTDKYNNKVEELGNQKVKKNERI